MQTKRMLLADDDEDDRLLFAEFINERKDMELIHCTGNGLEVVEYLKNTPDVNNHPHLIILDHNMPKMNGTQTLAALKSNHLFSHIPVAIYTTYSHTKLKQDCFDAGAAMVTDKPSSPVGYHKMFDEFMKLISVP